MSSPSSIKHSAEAVALVLAKSSADLSDEEACIDVLVQHRLLPWELPKDFCWRQVRIEAQHNRIIRAWNRLRTEPSVGAHLFVILSGSVMATCLASPCWAADGPLLSEEHGLWALFGVVVTAWICEICVRREDRR